MASIERSRDGWRVQYYLPNGLRKRIYVGKVSKAAANHFAKRIEELLGLAAIGSPQPAELRSWASRLAPRIAAHLAEVGLIERATAPDRLEEYIEAYICSRKDIKPRTAQWLRRSKKYLVDHFGGSRRIASITAGEAQRYASELRSKKASSTVGREVKRFRQFWLAAISDGVASANVWAGVSATMDGDASRKSYVDSSVIDRALEKIACPEIRAVVAMARWAGLRIPSEPLELTWADVDWESSRMIIRSPKNERHASGSREIPIFAQVRPYLEALWDLAGEEPHVFTRYRSRAAVVYRSRLLEAIERAGLEPWPKLFVNLRASCRIDLERIHPNHVCNTWLGHSGKVAEKYYLTVTEEDWARAR